MKNIISVILVIILILLLVYIYYKTKPIKSILFIGDSNTNASFSYADQLKKLNPELRIKKIVKDGATTDWMLQELKNELKQNKYDAVSILGGSNDIYSSGQINSTKINLNEMYFVSKLNGSKVIAVTPPNKDFYVNKTDQKQKLLYELNDWIKSNIYKDYFFNFWEITKNPNFFTSSDGYLHPQAQAHVILANMILKLTK